MDNHICRAKSLNTGEWVYGYYVTVPEEYSHGELVHAIFDPNESEHICMGEYKDYGWYEVDPDTVCRCTGLKDKNGTYIFEHDILYGIIYHMFEDKGTVEVRWNNHVAGFEANAFEPMKCEVIGNIFDNTELIED